MSLVRNLTRPIFLLSYIPPFCSGTCTSSASERSFRFKNISQCDEIGLPKCDSSTCYVAMSPQSSNILLNEFDANILVSWFIPDPNATDVICMPYSRDIQIGFQCENGDVISRNQFCDGVTDCDDGSDEYTDAVMEEGSTYRVALSPFSCAGTHGVCILPNRNLYDDIAHCKDGADLCLNNSCFECQTSKQIISSQLVCDGSIECFDSSDECGEYERNGSHLQYCHQKCEPIFYSDTEMIENVVFRAAIWIIGLLTIFGNSCVLISMLKALLEKKLNGPRKCQQIIVLNISVADLLMGVYLITICMKSAQFSGFYERYHFHWRYSLHCRINGMIATLSSQASCFFMVLLTAFRLRNICRPFSAESASWRIWKILVAVIWAGSVVIAYALVLPHFTFFASVATNLCLPLFYDVYTDMNENSIVKFSIITINFVCFLFVSAGYLCILYIFKKSPNRPHPNDQTAREDASMQKRIARIILTDCACWIPICIMSYISFAGVRLSDYAYLITAIFLLPINSALNPFIYSSLPDMITRVSFGIIKKKLRCEK